MVQLTEQNETNCRKKIMAREIEGPLKRGEHLRDGERYIDIRRQLRGQTPRGGDYSYLTGQKLLSFSEPEGSSQRPQNPTPDHIVRPYRPLLGFPRHVLSQRCPTKILSAISILPTSATCPAHQKVHNYENVSSFFPAFLSEYRRL